MSAGATQSQIEILLAARNTAQQAFADFSKSITDLTTGLLKSADASKAASSAQAQGADAARTGAAAHRETAAAAREAGEAHDDLRQILGPFISKYIEARTIYGLATEAYKDFTEFIRSSIDDYAEAEQSYVRLNAALKASGQATPQVTNEYKAYAEELERTTTVSHTAAMQAEEVFTTIGGVGPAMMQRALQAAADYSAGTGKSFESAAMLIAKASEGNVSALQRYGIQISKAQLETEGIGVVFDAIEGKFNGQSEAINGTLLGSWQQLSNKWTTAKEQLGGELAPAVELVGRGLGFLIDVVTDAPGAFFALIASFTALAASMAWVGVTQLYGAQFQRFIGLLSGPLQANLVLTAENSALAGGSILGLSTAEATAEATTVPLVGSVLGLSGAEVTLTGASEAATAGTVSLTSAMGLLKVAFPVAAAASFGYMVGSLINDLPKAAGGTRSFSDMLGDLLNHFSRNNLAAETAAAKQDTINRAYQQGYTGASDYASAVAYLNDKFGHAKEVTEQNAAAQKALQQQIDAIETSVLKAGRGADAMNTAFDDLNKNGLAYTSTAVAKLYPQVQQLIQSGATVSDAVKAWYTWATGIYDAEAATKKFQSSVLSMVEKLRGDTTSSIDVVTAAFKRLTPAQQESATTVEALTPIVKKFLDHAVAMPPALQSWASAHGVLSTEQAKFAKAWTDLNSLGATYRDTLASIDPAIAESVQYYAAQGASVADLTAAFPGLTDAQAKAATESIKIAQQTTAYLTKLHDDAAIAEAKSDQMGLAATIAGYNTRLSTAIAALDAEQVKTENAARDRATKEQWTEEQLQQALTDIDNRYNAERAQKTNEWATKKQEALLSIDAEIAKVEQSFNVDALQARLDTNAQELADKLRTIDLQLNGDQKLKDKEIALYQLKAQQIILANEPIWQAWVSLNADMRQDWANTWEQALQGQTSFASAALKPFTDLKDGIKKILASLLADLEAQFLNPLLNLIKQGVGSVLGGLAPTAAGGGMPGAGGFNLGSLFGGGGGGSLAGEGVSIGADGTRTPLAVGSGGSVMARGGMMAGGLLAGMGLQNFFGADQGVGKDVLSGVESGAGIGTMIAPGVGTLIGGGVGLLAGGVKSLFGKLFGGGPSKAELETRDTRGSLMSAFQSGPGIDSTTGAFTMGDKTGIQTLETQLTQVGFTAADAQKAVGRLLDAKTPEAFAAALKPINTALTAQKTIATDVDTVTKQVAAIWQGHAIPAAMKEQINDLAQMKGLTEDQKNALLSLTADARPNFESLQQVADKYGITLAGLGPKFEQGELEDKAAGLYQDFEDLTSAGGDVGGVLLGMSGQINDLVNESLQFGTKIPDNMKPLIQNLIDAGQLTDDNGKKITDISKLSFEDTPIASSVADLNKTMQQLVDVLQNQLPKAAHDFAATVPANPFAGWVPPELPDTSGAGFPGTEGGSTGGIITPFGIQRFSVGGVIHGPGEDIVPLWAKPGEMMLTQTMQSNLLALLRAPRATNSSAPGAGSQVHVVAVAFDAATGRPTRSLSPQEIRQLDARVQRLASEGGLRLPQRAVQPRVF